MSEDWAPWIVAAGGFAIVAAFLIPFFNRLSRADAAADRDRGIADFAKSRGYEHHREPTLLIGSKLPPLALFNRRRVDESGTRNFLMRQDGRAELWTFDFRWTWERQNSGLDRTNVEEYDTTLVGIRIQGARFPSATITMDADGLHGPDSIRTPAIETHFRDHPQLAAETSEDWIVLYPRPRQATGKSLPPSLIGVDQLDAHISAARATLFAIARALGEDMNATVEAVAAKAPRF